MESNGDRTSQQEKGSREGAQGPYVSKKYRQTTQEEAWGEGRIPATVRDLETKPGYPPRSVWGQDRDSHYGQTQRPDRDSHYGQTEGQGQDSSSGQRLSNKSGSGNPERQGYVFA